MRCNKCQFENAPNASVCSNCGAPLHAQPDLAGDTQVLSRAQLRRAREAARAGTPANQSEPVKAAPQAAAPAPRPNPQQPAAQRQPGQPAPQPSASQHVAGGTTATPASPASAPQTQTAPGAAPVPSAPSAPSVPQATTQSTNPVAAQGTAQAAAQAPQSAAQATQPETAKVAPPQSAARRPSAHNSADYQRRRPLPPPSQAELDADEAVFHSDRPIHAEKSTFMIAGICALGVLTLGLVILCFLTFTNAGQRWKASNGMNAPAAIYWQLGDEALSEGDAEGAASYYDAAFSRDSNNYDGAIKLAQTLEAVGNAERAERAYRKAISIEPTRTEAYDSVIELMIARAADDSEMVDMLKLAYQNTSGADYNTLLLTYGPSTVRFDPEEGTYDYAVKLQMACDDGATIYYTTDGTQPTIYSSKYVLPIELGEGVFTVRAIAYLNDLYSGETHKTYTIVFPAVDAPQFNSKPGKYAADEDGRKVITVTVPDGCTVYYTTDGSAPTTDSSEYDDGISLRPGTYTLRMIAVNPGGQTSSETSAEYQIIEELQSAFNDEDSFLSFRVDVTTQEAVNNQFKLLLETTGDINTFFTQHYNFGEVDFTVKGGVPLVTAVRITNSDITGVRGTKVGWSAQDVLELFRNEQNDIVNGEQVLYTLADNQYGWIEYNSSGIMTSINYMYVRNGAQLVELHYTIEDGDVAAMEYCISDM